MFLGVLREECKWNYQVDIKLFDFNIKDDVTLSEELCARSAFLAAFRILQIYEILLA